VVRHHRAGVARGVALCELCVLLHHRHDPRWRRHALQHLGAAQVGQIEAVRVGQACTLVPRVHRLHVAQHDHLVAAPHCAVRKLDIFAQ